MGAQRASRTRRTPAEPGGEQLQESTALRPPRLPVVSPGSSRRSKRGRPRSIRGHRYGEISVLQRQDDEEAPEPAWKENEKRFELTLKSLDPQKPKSNLEQFQLGLDKIFLKLGEKETPPLLIPGLKATEEGQLVWTFLTKTGSAAWLLSRGKLPNVIPDIKLRDDITLNVELGGTLEKPELKAGVTFKF